MAAFLYIDLEQIAHVIKRWRGQAKKALLLDRARLGVTLDHDKATQHRPVFAWHFLPRQLAGMLTTRNTAVFDLRREKDTPSVFRHFHIIKLGPTACLNPYGGTKIDLGILKLLRDKLRPPVDIAGMPLFKRLQDAAVRGQVDVVWNFRVIANIHHILHHSHPRKNSHAIRRAPCCTCRAHQFRSAAEPPPHQRRWAAGKSNSARR